jgi:hypothetical protein
MNPELRRCAIYVLLSLPVVLSVVWVQRLNQNPSIVGVAVIGLFFGLPGLSMLLPLRWLLRVDGKGIARRRLLGWDSWEWSDFDSGRIQKERPFVFVDWRRPWWRRRLALCVSAQERKELVNLINLYYRLPPPPPVGETLTIHYRFPRVAIFEPSGIRLGKQRLARDKLQEDRCYTWSDVRRVHITRTEPVRRDFTRLEIVLPDEGILLVTTTDGPAGWRGAPPEELNEFLHHRVSSERIEVDIAGERPARRSDLEKTLERAIKDEKVVRNSTGIWAVFFGILTLWQAVGNRWEALGILIMGSVMCSLFLLGFLHCKRRVQQIGRELAAYDQESTIETDQLMDPRFQQFAPR